MKLHRCNRESADHSESRRKEKEMLKMKYIGLKTEYDVEFSNMTKNLVQVKGDVQAKTNGFTLSRPDKNDGWDYSAFTTVYREMDGIIQFSNDGSIYVPPEPTPEPEPYVPTLEEVKASKVAEMNNIQQSVIQSGFDVILTDGTVEHFTLTDHDQTSLMGLQTQVAQGAENIPWHTSDTAEHCKYYSNADMLLIVTAAMQYVTFHVTYFRDLRIYINAMDDKESVEAVTYGIVIPEEYRSEVLKDLYAAMGV